MIGPVLRVQYARWTRAHPGRLGLALFLLTPLVFLLPLQAVGLFQEWKDGAGILALLIPLCWVAVLARDSGRPEPSLIWLYQKGVRIEDWVILRWLSDLMLTTILALLLGPALLAGAWFWSSSWQPAFAIAAAAGGLCLALTAGAFLLAAGAAGTTRGVDLLTLLMVLGAVEPLFGSKLRPPVKAALHWIVPPVLDSAQLGSQLVRQNWHDALHSGLHVALWWTVMVLIALTLLARWRPGVGAT